MKLWLIVRDENDVIFYDEFRGHVVAASNSQQVRRMVADNHRDEGERVWLDPKLSSVSCIAETCTYDRPEIILSDFLAG